MTGWMEKNAHSYQSLYFNFYFIINFGLMAEPTAPTTSRESRSPTREKHIKGGSRGMSRALPIVVEENSHQILQEAP